ncbi:MAG: hypothetical protein AAF846_20945, partial [Chloroflexota bacterium]
YLEILHDSFGRQMLHTKKFLIHLWQARPTGFKFTKPRLEPIFKTRRLQLDDERVQSMLQEWVANGEILLKRTNDEYITPLKWD